MEWTTQICQKLKNIRSFQEKYFKFFPLGQLINLIHLDLNRIVISKYNHIIFNIINFLLYMPC